MTYAYIAIVAVSTVVSATAAIRQGQAAQAMANFNAQQAQQAAQQSREAGSTAEDEQRAKARQMIGTEMAGQASAGTQLNGSAADVLKQSLFNAESDSQQIRYEAENKARGFTNQATGDQFGGKTAMNNAYMSATGSLLSGAAQAYGAYNKPPVTGPSGSGG